VKWPSSSNRRQRGTQCNCTGQLHGPDRWVGYGPAEKSGGCSAGKANRAQKGERNSRDEIEGLNPPEKFNYGKQSQFQRSYRHHILRATLGLFNSRNWFLHQRLKKKPNKQTYKTIFNE
jgi:hypothetical protein